MPATGVLRIALVAAVCAGAAGCERERRPLPAAPPAAAPAQATPQTPLQAGTPRPYGGESPFQRNAWSISEGQQLFSAFNCTGCHAQGGGAIGPALMDDEWIYGAEPENIHDSIVRGRPDGMPSFAGRIADQQVWQIVAFVQSLSGQTPALASPGRTDDLKPHRPSNLEPATIPVQTGHQ